MASNRSAMVIGAGGGIGRALVSKLLNSGAFARVHAVSRSNAPIDEDGVDYHQIDSGDERQIRDLCERLGKHEQFALVICCIGILHNEREVWPEKKLEDINSSQLMQYFETNAVLPMLWMKHAVALLKGSDLSHFVQLSARVGSITDNRLGGWYGYRASKAAVNMLLKTAQVEYARRARNVALVSYHPGTVDTGLSDPFQANVPKDKLFTAEFTASQLLAMLPRLTTENAPHYVDWQGKEILW